MDLYVDINSWDSNIPVKDIKFWTIYTGDLFIVTKVCEEPATPFG